MPIKFEHTTDRLTRRAGMIIVNEFGNRIELQRSLDAALGLPGSNRGIKASDYIQTLVDMFIDGALSLEDVRSLEWDEAYKTLIERDAYPSSDAIGDWLRRHGGRDGERRLWHAIADVLTLNTDSDLTLDIDTTLIEADKGDATMSYKGIRGYQPLLGIIASNGLIVGSEFRFGNESPQANLARFIRQCERHLPNRITTIRSDSAAYNAEVINECMDRERPLRFTITADQDSAVLGMVSKIPQNEWKRGVNADGTAANWEVAETVHTMEHTKHSFRLAAKRTEDHRQIDLFQGDHYRYWIVATDIPEEELDANGVILFHQQRGEMERLIGELKNYFNLDHLPCGQFDANALYFTTGILAYNIVQLIKQVALGADWMKKSIRTLRYRLFHLSAKVISHARYLIVRIACVPAWFEQFMSAHARLRYAPLAPS